MAVSMHCHISRKEMARDVGGMVMPEAPQDLTRKWYFTKDELECHTPSRADGIDYEQEESLRKLYCSFLQELGMELKVPQVTIATALMFCHRFYMRQSHGKNDWQTVATACMFLACKAEETPQWLGELVVMAYKLIHKGDPSASRRIREIYDKQKELILIGERLLLHTIAFDLNIEHPYKSLVRALKRLNITHKELVKVAWNFVNDSLHSSLCLQHKPHYIAAGSLYLASKVKNVILATANDKAWWMEFDVAPKQLKGVIEQMKIMWEEIRSQNQIRTPKDQNIIKSQTTKVPIHSPQSSTLSGSSIVHDSKAMPSKAAGEPARPLTSNIVKKQGFEKVYDTSKETLKCQTSDTGSAVSVVEDGDSGEPVTVSDLSSICKVVLAEVVVDVNRIREKLKKRNSAETMKRKRIEDMGNEVDGEDWIERELENGIVLESSYSKKQAKT
uniref:cyclin-T1-3-like n=1 Tax=Erigeron canadensis TaxID=72917 RepID=UPI001CB9103A|nr:cyclin-T1-3-like [Erigeron canadensis]XP_043606301.1 cyclin-T1-3-like [Erigeron canadensis]